MTEGCCDGSSACDCSNLPENRMCMRATPPHKFDLVEYRKRMDDPKFICRCCGRVANLAEDLCSPTEL